MSEQTNLRPEWLGSAHAVDIWSKSGLLSGGMLKRCCNVDHLRKQLESSSGDGSLFSPIGQKRAIESLEFGLDMKAKGYNIFVVGMPGNGKTSFVLRHVKERAFKEKNPSEFCFAYNFQDPSRPLSLLLPFGMGVTLKKELSQVIAGLSKSIAEAFSEETFLNRVSDMTEQADKKLDALFAKIYEIAEKHELGLEREQSQFMLVPLLHGEPIETSVFEGLSVKEQERLQEKIGAFQREAAPWITSQREHQRAAQDRLQCLEKLAIEGMVEHAFSHLFSLFTASGESIVSYLNEMKEYLIKNYRDLLVDASGGEEGKLRPLTGSELLPPYNINVMNHSHREGAPVIVEREPSLSKLFGFLEYSEGPEGLMTDHLQIQPGSLHEANGGYLILQAADVACMPDVWEALKRALRHQEIRIRDLSMDPGKPRISGTVRPMEASLNVKVIMIGSAKEYYTLRHQDEDFSRVFKVKSEFQQMVPWDSAHEIELCRFMQRICEEEGLLHPSCEALALLIEESAREAESQYKLSTSVLSSLDLLCEADHWARHRNGKVIQDVDIRHSLRFREYRHACLEETIMETIERGEVLIDTDGEVVGQVNALMVYMEMEHRFGVPSKITARTYVGRQGIQNIDREANLSGTIHDKGTMILVGLLGGLCAQHFPLSLNASITFEQNYGEIEGDSASCAEFYALLSSLAQVSIFQGIAVTGSVNQQGYVQPIGEVNAKIEGMFEICQRRGFTGRQGVIIPEQNTKHLMLRDDVVEMVNAGKFHIWKIHHVFEGVEILMNIRAGTQVEEGIWTEGSLFDKVQNRLEKLYRMSLPSRGFETSV